MTIKNLVADGHPEQCTTTELALWIENESSKMSEKVRATEHMESDYDKMENNLYEIQKDMDRKK